MTSIIKDSVELIRGERKFGLSTKIPMLSGEPTRGEAATKNANIPNYYFGKLGVKICINIDFGLSTRGSNAFGESTSAMKTSGFKMYAVKASGDRISVRKAHGLRMRDAIAIGERMTATKAAGLST